MAFQYKLNSGHRIDPKGKIIYVKELTGTIGAKEYTEDPSNPNYYVETINSTGYGTPNPARASVANFLVVYLKKSTGNVLQSVKISDPQSVVEYEVTATEDGWYEFHLISVGTATAPVAASYASGSAIYNTTTDKLYQKQGSVLVEIAPSVLVDTVYDVVITDKFFVPLLTKEKISLNTKRNLLTLEADPEKEIARLTKRYNTLSGLLEGAIYEFCRGNKSVAQKHIEYLTTNYINC